MRLIVSVRNDFAPPAAPAAQPTEDHLPGLGAGGQLRVIAAHLGVAELGALMRVTGLSPVHTAGSG
jgi:hypothetical protein